MFDIDEITVKQVSRDIRIAFRLMREGRTKQGFLSRICKARPDYNQICAELQPLNECDVIFSVYPNINAEMRADFAAEFDDPNPAMPIIALFRMVERNVSGQLRGSFIITPNFFLWRNAEWEENAGTIFSVPLSSIRSIKQNSAGWLCIDGRTVCVGPHEHVDIAILDMGFTKLLEACLTEAQKCARG